MSMSQRLQDFKTIVVAESACMMKWGVAMQVHLFETLGIRIHQELYGWEIRCIGTVVAGHMEWKLVVMSRGHLHTVRICLN
jgi:hypothetical protein